MLVLNRSYLNRSPNKTARPAGSYRPAFVVVHETAGYGSLDWGLNPAARSSFNYLIVRNGTIYHYVDERRYIAWHGGVGPASAPHFGLSRHQIGNTLYWGRKGSYTLPINTVAIGVELEGPNDGTPITAAQTTAMVALMRYFQAEYGIPISPDYYPAHSAIAPVYKSDPQGTTIAALIAAAAPEPLYGADTPVLGVRAKASLGQFTRSLQRHAVAMTELEIERLYRILTELEIEPAFFIGLWHSEDATFGRGILQRQTRCPINIKAAPGEWRPTVAYRDAVWQAFESLFLGGLGSVLHIKNGHGWAGRHTLGALIHAHAPASDGNNPEQIIRNIAGDMAFILSN